MTRQRLRKILYIALLGLACLAVAPFLFGFGSWGKDTREALPSENFTQGDPNAVTVTVKPVELRTVQRTVEAVGTLHGYEEVTISAKVEGRVQKIHHDVADRVEPGALLLEINPTDYELAMSQAEQSLQVELARLGLDQPPESSFDLTQVPPVVQARVRMDNFKTRMDRLLRLAANRAASEEDQTNARSDYLAAQAEYASQMLLARAGLATVQMRQAALAVARQQLKDTQVSAPIPSVTRPGVGPVTYAITQRLVAEGTYVRPGTEVFRLVIDRPLKLRVAVPERYTSEVKKGQKAEVVTAALPRATSGIVSRTNPAVDPDTRTFEVEILVPNAEGELKPGSFAKASILTRLDPMTATIPIESVVRFAGISKIFVIEDGKAKEIQVTLGVQSTEWVEVVEPRLSAEGQVITSGHLALADGVPVAIRASSPSSTPKK